MKVKLTDAKKDLAIKELDFLNNIINEMRAFADGSVELNKKELKGLVDEVISTARVLRKIADKDEETCENCAHVKDGGAL